MRLVLELADVQSRRVLIDKIGRGFRKYGAVSERRKRAVDKERIVVSPLVSAAINVSSAWSFRWPRCSLPRRLTLLHLVLLSSMLLFQLLCLLRVALFHLLFLGVVVISFRRLLVFFFLLLLQFLMILCLLRS